MVAQLASGVETTGLAFTHVDDWKAGDVSLAREEGSVEFEDQVPVKWVCCRKGDGGLVLSLSKEIQDSKLRMATLRICEGSLWEKWH